MSEAPLSNRRLDLEELKWGLRGIYLADAGYMERNKFEKFCKRNGYTHPHAINVKHIRINIAESYDPATKTVTMHICPAGTNPKDARDIWTDISFLPFGKTPMGGYTAHGGFTRTMSVKDENGITVASHLFDYIALRQKQLKALDPEIKLKFEFDAHSLGGTIALHIVQLAHNKGFEKSITGILTYGAPRYTNEAGAKHFNKTYAGRTIQFINEDDPIPQLPGKIGTITFSHVGRQVIFTDNGHYFIMDTDGLSQYEKQRLAALPPARPEDVEQIKSELLATNQITTGTDKLSEKAIDQMANLIARDPLTRKEVIGRLSNAEKDKGFFAGLFTKIYNGLGFDRHERTDLVASYSDKFIDAIDREENGDVTRGKKPIIIASETLSPLLKPYDKNKDNLLTKQEIDTISVAKTEFFEDRGLIMTGTHEIQLGVTTANKTISPYLAQYDDNKDNALDKKELKDIPKSWLPNLKLHGINVKESSYVHLTLPTAEQNKEAGLVAKN